MIPIVRTQIPQELKCRMMDLTREIVNVERGERSGKARSIWDRKTVRRDIYTLLRNELLNMAPGLGCCMYCGHDLADNIDHYVPIAVDPARTFCWYNHILSCSTCNSRYKRERYATDVFGNPLLLDPTRDDPFDHLHLALSTGLYVELTQRGKYTIEACGLNRDKRPEARQRARDLIGILLERWWQATRNGDNPSRLKYLGAIQEQPFADVCQAMIRQASHEAADVFFDGFMDLVTVLRSAEVRSELLIAH